MARYGMTTPQGESVYSDDPAWLEDKILRGGPDFWNSDAGDAAVERGQSQIHLVFHEDHGFALTFYEPNQVSYVSWAGEDYGKPVEVCVGGSLAYYPVAEFVSRESTWQVVRNFCEKGSRSNQIRWRSASDLDWDVTTGKRVSSS
jgi:hypothetical protein